MRIGVGDDLHSSALQHGNGVGGRRLDEVHLAGQQGRRAGRRLRHRQQDQLVLLRHARLVPVILVRCQLHPLMRSGTDELIRPGAGGMAGIGVPVVFQRLRPAAADHQHVGHVVGEKRLDELCVDRDGVVVDLLDAVEIREVSARKGELLRVELRRVLVADPLEVPHHVVGVEIAAIVPFHALAQREDPSLVVIRIDVPFGRQARLDVGSLGG